MKQIMMSLVAVLGFTAFSAHSQNSSEVDRASKTVQQLHLYDEFYLQIMCRYDVEMSRDVYILLKENGIGIWRAEHRKEMTDPPPWEGDRDTQRKVVTYVSYMEDSKIEAFLKAIDIDRLEEGSAIDSLTLVDTGEEKILGGYKYFAIMICTNGTFRLIEYPARAPRYDKSRYLLPKSVVWKSAYLDNLIARFTQALPMGSEPIFEVNNGELKDRGFK